MNGLLARIEAVFGQVLPEALFYQFDNALRFELSPGGDWPTRILCGYQRAREVIDALPASDNEWEVAFTSHGESIEECASRFDKETLEIYGCKQQVVSLAGVIYAEKEFARTVFTLDPAPSIEACLLAGLASDCSSLVTPFPGSPYLIDWKNEIIVYPYDDRGMDVIATDKSVLLPTYERFRSWLLDYDLPRMDQQFGA